MFQCTALFTTCRPSVRRQEPEFFSNDCGYNPGECSKADQQRYIHKARAALLLGCCEVHRTPVPCVGSSRRLTRTPHAWRATCRPHHLPPTERRASYWPSSPPPLPPTRRRCGWATPWKAACRLPLWRPAPTTARTGGRWLGRWRRSSPGLRWWCRCGSPSGGQACVGAGLPAIFDTQQGSWRGVVLPLCSAPALVFRSPAVCDGPACAGPALGPLAARRCRWRPTFWTSTTRAA